jgi:hypothetical protein
MTMAIRYLFLANRRCIHDPIALVARKHERASPAADSCLLCSRARDTTGCRKREKEREWRGARYDGGQARSYAGIAERGGEAMRARAGGGQWNDDERSIAGNKSSNERVSPLLSSPLPPSLSLSLSLSPPPCKNILHRVFGANLCSSGLRY